MDIIKKKAYAKINLSLDVLGKRPNGYHDVRMIMQSVGLYDELTFKINPNYQNSAEYENESGNQSGPVNASNNQSSLLNELNNQICHNDKLGQIILEFENPDPNIDLGPVEKNLIYRAAKLILETYNITDTGVIISLSKHIPVAAGMAGGSTDAAAVFHGLNELLTLGMTLDDMCSLGVKIGADVPFCIMSGTAVSEGIGEILTPISAPPKAVLVIAKPKIDVSTKMVYEELDSKPIKHHPDVDGMINAISNQDLIEISQLLGNVLETVTVDMYPIIDSIKSVINESGALNALMSGSGPTVFGLFRAGDEESARRAVAAIKSRGLADEVFITEFVDSESACK